MEFYPAGNGDIQIRAWDAITGNEVIVYLPRIHAEKVYNYIQAHKKATKESLLFLASFA